MTEKEKYFNELYELETAELFLTNSVDTINEEIHHNCIQVSIPTEIAQQTTSNDFISFLDKVKSNRKQQLQQSSLDINLIYYLWLDELAGQLRFNFINSNHSELPFKCKLVFVDTEQEIVDGFLNSNYLQGIPWDEFETNANTPEEKEVYTLKVYRQQLSKH